MSFCKYYETINIFTMINLKSDALMLAISPRIYEYLYHFSEYRRIEFLLYQHLSLRTDHTSMGPTMSATI
eukprot:gene12174-14249_t